MARQISSGHILYLNLSPKPQVIPCHGKLRSILRDRDYADRFTIEPFEPEFIEMS